MKIAVALIFALVSQAAIAATPITCAALSALGYNYVYFGFTTSGTTDTFKMAGSMNEANWTNIPATWPTCGNGTPCKVNSPSALEYTDSSTNVCHVYLLMAEANDAALTLTKQDIGVLNDDFTVTTLLTFDWASLGAVVTVYAGRWNKVAGSTNCFVTPVDFTGGAHSFSTYAACAALTPTSASISSGPTLLTTTGNPTGYDPGYDPQVIQAGSTCYLVQTETTSGFPYAVTSLSTGSCPNGPFTWQTNAYQTSSILGAQVNLSTKNEGPNYIQTTNTGGWYFWYEDLPHTQMYSVNCTPIALTSCYIATPQPWIEDQTYRAGTILRTATTPLPSTTLYGGTLKGGTWQ